MTKSVGSLLKDAWLHPFRYGIATRQEYWCVWLVSFVISFVLGFVVGFVKSFVIAAGYHYLSHDDVAMISFTANFLLFLTTIWSCVVIWALQVRRLHDIGFSGWWILFPPIFIFVIIISIEFIFGPHLGFNGGLQVGAVIALAWAILLGIISSKIENNPRAQKAKKAKVKIKE